MIIWENLHILEQIIHTKISLYIIIIEYAYVLTQHIES